MTITIKELLTNPADFEYIASCYTPNTTKKHYYAFRTPLPIRLPRSQRIPHLKRAGFKK